MHKTIFIILMTCLPSFMAFAQKLAEREIVPKFYEILLSDTPPSAVEERAFFGESKTRNAILTALQHASGAIDIKARDGETPVWDWLRKNKHLFVSKNVNKASEFRCTISEPFDMAWHFGNGHASPAEVRGRRVMVQFLKEYRASGGPGTLAILVFYISEDPYLEKLPITQVNREGDIILMESGIKNPK